MAPHGYGPIELWPYIVMAWCSFPFSYKGKTYSTCTREGSETGEYWCHTDRQ